MIKSQSPKTCIGFDFRISPAKQNTRWPLERKREWLIKQDCIPLSVDQQVWESPLDWTKSFAKGKAISIPPLFKCFKEIKYECDKSTDAKDGVVIGIFIEDSIHCILGVHNSISPSDFPLPTVLVGNSLGFDVADAWLLSVLMNGVCFNDVKYQRIVDEFSRNLNAYHLFSKVDHAKRYAEVMRDILRDHLPLIVYEVVDVSGEE